MSMKFRKNREVDSRYLNVPVKYVLNYAGANDGEKDKTLCIIDFYGKHLALVGWRNAETFSIGKTRLCRVVYKKDKVYIRYKGKDILISDKSGWVF